MQDIIDSIVAEIDALEDRGAVANYIPALARIDPGHFGLAIVLDDGTTHVAGDADVSFSIQSISKVFTLTLAMQRVGDDLWKRVGREPSGSAFNSIVQLESEGGIPRNPLINAGAIVVSDVLMGDRQPRDAIAEIVNFIRGVSGDASIDIDFEVAESEADTGFRNAALANYMRSFGNMAHRVDDALRVYFHQCSIAMTCRQLAMAGRYLMRDGQHPNGSSSIVTALQARRINALMLTCGHYDGSGEFAFRVGIPGKSGVGGGILAIVPGKASIAVWSPGLNSRGNSKLGTRALERLAEATGWSVFMPAR